MNNEQKKLMKNFISVLAETNGYKLVPKDRVQKNDIGEEFKSKYGKLSLPELKNEIEIVVREIDKSTNANNKIVRALTEKVSEFKPAHMGSIFNGKTIDPNKVIVRSNKLRKLTELKSYLESLIKRASEKDIVKKLYSETAIEDGAILDMRHEMGPNGHSLIIELADEAEDKSVKQTDEVKSKPTTTDSN